MSKTINFKQWLNEMEVVKLKPDVQAVQDDAVNTAMMKANTNKGTDPAEIIKKKVLGSIGKKINAKDASAILPTGDDLNKNQI